jgi:hypothetical protein
VGKSRLYHEMRSTLKLSPANCFYHSAAPFFAATAEGKTIAAAPFFFDDLEHV